MFEADGAPLLTGVKPGDVAQNIILAVRDPLGFDEDAAWQISRKMDDVRLVADTGMFITLTGTYKGASITVCSTGSGTPDTEIPFAELAQAAGGRPTIVRVGTSGSAHHAVKVGDLVISTAAVRSEGTTAAYVPPEYPAVADHFVVEYLRRAALELGVDHHLGITRSTDSIYAGQGREVLGFSPPGLETIPSFWAGVNVLNYERETSLILTLGNVFGYRVGSVCSVVNSAVSGDLDAGAGVDAAIVVALEGLAKLADLEA
jgi:uridine phosphorylase